MRNYQIYPYFLRDGVVLHDTGVGTVPNKQNFASTAKRCPLTALQQTHRSRPGNIHSQTPDRIQHIADIRDDEEGV